MQEILTELYSTVAILAYIPGNCPKATGQRLGPFDAVSQQFFVSHGFHRFARIGF